MQAYSFHEKPLFNEHSDFKANPLFTIEKMCVQNSIFTDSITR